jgi:ribonuclease-3 family protein
LDGDIMDIKEVNSINAGVLAYLGDSVYEIQIRNYLVNKKIGNVNNMDKEAVNFVSAVNQARILDKLLEKNILTEEELYTINRARNYKPNSKPRYVDIKTYKKATALESLFGMLYLTKNDDRIDIIMKEILGD